MYIRSLASLLLEGVCSIGMGPSPLSPKAVARRVIALVCWKVGGRLRVLVDKRTRPDTCEVCEMVGDYTGDRLSYHHS